MSSRGLTAPLPPRAALPCAAPQNVLISEDGLLKIADLGISQVCV